MSKIYVHEIDPLIEKLKAAGIDPIKEDYIIVAHPDVEFDADVFPLEIVTNKLSPKNAVYLMKRPPTEGTAP